MRSSSSMFRISPSSPLALFLLASILSSALPSLAHSVHTISLMDIHNIPYGDDSFINDEPRPAGHHFVVARQNDGEEVGDGESAERTRGTANERTRDEVGPGGIAFIEAPLKVSNPIWNILSRANSFYRRMMRRQQMLPAAGDKER